MPRARQGGTVQSRARALALARTKARLERRRDFLRELERARTMTPQQRLQTALDLIDSMMELKEAAENATTRPSVPRSIPRGRNQKNTRRR